MISRMGLLSRKQDLSLADFASYWMGKHRPLVCNRIPALKGYVQNLVTDQAQRGIDFKRGPLSFDGFSQLTFDSLTEMRQLIGPSVVEALVADEANFLHDITVITTLRNVVVTPPKSGKFAKRMSILRKRPNITIAEFQSEWFNAHSFLVKRIPGLLGYRQNLVIDRQKNRMADADDGMGLGIDGIVELWFEDVDAIERGFRSDRGKTTMMHAQEFISEISTFMVEATVIIPES
jgi:uncharacterized protein (TIGR02118 family)